MKLNGDYLYDYFINHAIRIPLQQPGFHGMSRSRPEELHASLPPVERRRGLVGVGDLVLVKELLRPAKLADFYLLVF